MTNINLNSPEAIKTVFVNQLFDGAQMLNNVKLSIVNGRITEMDSQCPQRDAQQCDELISALVAPGFIDVQVNGGGGVLFNDDPCVDAITCIGRAHGEFGTTSFFPTLITDDVEKMQAAAEAISAAIKAQMAGVYGVHFEGPHLAKARKGVHAPEHIRPISDAEMALFTRQDLGQVIVTLAPENVSPSDISKLKNSGVIVCLGHSDADFATVIAAIDAGASGFTHLFNAMSPMQSREPGMVGAALLDESSWCGIIVDGHHVHNATLQLAIKAKPAGKVILVTDAMPPVGSTEHSFKLYGDDVIRSGDRLNALTGELAGSVLDMAGAVKNTINRLGVSPEEAIRMASLYPAQFLGLDKTIGMIGLGYQANFVVFDDKYNVTQTWLSGNKLAKNNN